ncbi:MAG: hypothetical protein AMXMBFR23_03880 [Chloroflexota bacterium]
MNNQIRLRLLAVLVDPDVSEEQLGSVAHWLTSGGGAELARAAVEARRRITASPDDPPRTANDPGLVQRTTPKRALPTRVSSTPHATSQATNRQALRDDIAELLLRRLGLNVEAASKALAREVRYPNALPIRKAFGVYVDRLADYAGDSVLLSAAYRIAKDRGLTDFQRDWPVDRGG